MGSYIGVVAIYIEEFNSFNSKLYNIINTINQLGIKISSKDISQDSYIKTSVKTNFFSSKNCLLTVCSNEYCCGVGLSIPENELFNNNYSCKRINEIDKWITESMKIICNAINCDFIFCDNEADFLDFKYNYYDKTFNTNFSIFIDNRNKKIIQNNWNIDGLTKRTEYYNI